MCNLLPEMRNAGVQCEHLLVMQVAFYVHFHV